MTILVIALASTAAAGAVTAGPASAFSQYSGELFGNVNLQADGQSAGGGASGTIYGQAGWAAPSGTNFAAFGYTSGSFASSTASLYGGISAGFGGDGTVNSPSLLFPGTGDCAIASNDGWAYNDIPAGTAESNWQSSCQSNGVDNAWTTYGQERSFANPSTDPQVGWSDLYLDLFCESASGACPSTDTALVSVTNLSAIVYDPNDQPDGSASWSGNSGTWVQTNSGNVSLNGSATDPSGVCSMNASIAGPGNSTITSGALGNQAPGIVNVGDWIGTEMGSATNPCWVGQTDTGSWTLPSGLTSGTYTGSIEASNAGNYQSQGYSANGSPVVASASSSINVDDQTPSVSPQDATGSSSWTSANDATVLVSSGPSGVSSTSCTDNGASVAASLTGSSGNSYTYTVPLSPGSNSIQCSARNGDANGALTGTSSPAVYRSDASVPVITYSDGGYTAGTWTGVQQTIEVTATGGPSGVSGLACALDGNALPDSSGDTMSGVVTSSGVQSATITVSADGAHDLRCAADNSGTPSIVGSGDYQIDVDTELPVTSFVTGSSYAATSSQASDPQTAPGQNWINGTSGPIMIGVTGTEPRIVSGVQDTVCTINDYTTKPEVLTNAPTSGTIAQNTPFVATFTADPKYGWIDGQNVVSCQSETPAGLIAADGNTVGSTAVEYVDVNDAAWPTTVVGPQTTLSSGKCGISSVIDNGGCAYSDGPDQKDWYSSPQTLVITADDTGAAAPITSVTCSGAQMAQSSWTAAADPQDVDSNNGMTVTATIEPSGGTFDCTASDSAQPADTFDLGTYNVSIDLSEPSGFFEPQGYQGAAQNIIQLKLADNPSGTKQVTVQATDQNTGVVYNGAQLTSNPADGSTAYASYDANTGTWNLTVNPAVFPSVNDHIAFVATATTGAGVSASISTLENGSQEILTPGGQGSGGLGYTPLTPPTAPTAPTAPMAATSAPATSVPSTSAAPTTVGGAYSPTGDSTLITATARTGHWTAAGVSEKQLNVALQSMGLQAKRSDSIAPPSVGTIASWKHSVCKAVRNTKKHSRNATRGKQREALPKRFCRTLTSRAPRSEALPANYNQKTEIAGTLIDTQTHKPIAGGSVAIYTTNLATDEVKLVHTATTGARGNFKYRLAAGPDRRIDLVHLGKAGVTQGADTAFDTTTAGRVRAHAPKVVRVGQNMRITGRILGGSINAKGAIVQMEYSIAGLKRGWAPFKPGRSKNNGAFVIRFPITRTSAGLTYRVRIRVPSQSGWGFRGTNSNILRFRVK